MAAAAAASGPEAAAGGAGVNKATTLSGASEQDAIAQLQAKIADSTRQLSYLTSDGDIAKANADLKNAQDALAAITADQNRRAGSITAPFQLAGADLSLKGALNDQQYNGLDALIRRLGSFTTQPASGPGLTTSNPGSVLNSDQITGGALSSLGSILGNSSSNKTLQQIIDALKGTGTTPGAGAGTPSGTPSLSGVV